MVDKPARKRIILFKLRFHRGELAPPHMQMIHWMGAKDIQPLPAVNGIFCSLPPGISDKEIATSGGVVAVEENFTIKLNSYQVVPFNPIWPYGEQLMPRGICNIGAPNFWSETRGEGVSVAVMDTGIDGSHPDLKPNLKGGINLIHPGKSYFDDHGHGTHMAGIIAAGDTGKGIIGAAPEARLYAVKVLDQKGEGTVYHVISALQWCSKHKMHVVSMSFVLDKYSRALEEAVRYARRRGLFLVAAAGNHQETGVDYPAMLDETVRVAAVEDRSKPADFDDGESKALLVGPGRKIVSTYRWGTYACLTGNSMAMAHVSGVAALLKAKYPGEDVEKLHRRLRSGAVALKGPDQLTAGAGIVRVDES